MRCLGVALLLGLHSVASGVRCKISYQIKNGKADNHSDMRGKYVSFLKKNFNVGVWREFKHGWERHTDGLTYYCLMRASCSELESSLQDSELFGILIYH